MDNYEPLQKRHGSCLQPQNQSHCRALFASTWYWEYLSGSSTSYSFVYLFLYFLVQILPLKISKFSEYFSVNIKQLKFCHIYKVSTWRTRSHAAGVREVSKLFFRCFCSCLVFIPYFQYIIPCVSPHFLPVSDSTLSYIHLDPCNLWFSSGGIWQLLLKADRFSVGKCLQVKSSCW